MNRYAFLPPRSEKDIKTSRSSSFLTCLCSWSGDGVLTTWIGGHSQAYRLAFGAFLVEWTPKDFCLVLSLYRWKQTCNLSVTLVGLGSNVIVQPSLTTIHTSFQLRIIIMGLRKEILWRTILLMFTNRVSHIFWEMVFLEKSKCVGLIMW